MGSPLGSHVVVDALDRSLLLERFHSKWDASLDASRSVDARQPDAITVLFRTRASLEPNNAVGCRENQVGLFVNLERTTLLVLADALNTHCELEDTLAHAGTVNVSPQRWVGCVEVQIALLGKREAGVVGVWLCA